MSDVPNDVVEEIRQEFNSIDRRMQENTTLMEQSQLEVDRLQQRNVTVNAQVRRVQENFDTLPRQDIKVAYEEALDAKQRLLTMRCQLEKLHDNQSQLDVYRDLLGRLLGLLEGVALPAGGGSAESADGPSLGLAGETIIRIVQAQEQERRALANSLHDGPAQSLTNFILQAEVCQQLFNRDPDRANSELNNLKTAASSTFQKIRDFIFDLRPMMLDDLGLIPTLRRYVENFENKHGVTVQFNVLGEENRRLPRHTEVMVFRSVQSLLAVSVQQLKAHSLRLVVDVGDSEVKATLEDDGQGFDPIVDLDPSQGDSDVQAINTVRERVELINGSIDIYSAEGEGSRFAIRLPIYEGLPDY